MFIFQYKLFKQNWWRIKKEIQNIFKFYLYEYMDKWEKFNETTLPKKENFYSNLNMEDIADADYMHAKRVCKFFETVE